MMLAIRTQAGNPLVMASKIFIEADSCISLYMPVLSRQEIPLTAI